MMRCTPNCRVCYQGIFRVAGQSFEIDPADAEMMREYGAVESDAEEVPETPKKATRTGSRQKKNT